MTEPPTESVTRGSPELWLQAARDALLEGGVESVKIQVLAKNLNLSRASFYWFFKDRDELLDALLTQWREKNTGNIIKRANAYADSLAEAILNVCDCWFDQDLFDSRFEFAIRSWSLQSPKILAEVQQADTARIAALTAMYERFGRSAVAADVRARTIYLVQIGYISMQTREDIRLRMSRMPEYVQIYTGVAPEAREMNRFFSRHGVSFTEQAPAHG
jgi:AcrR family transcriptional regulator